MTPLDWARILIGLVLGIGAAIELLRRVQNRPGLPGTSLRASGWGMSYCDCDWGDYSPAEFVQVYTVKKARKPHRCEECGGRINIGESYQRIDGKWDGDMASLCTCKDCIEIENWARISAPCFCTITGELHERVREMVQDVAPHVPGFVFEWGRRMVKVRRRQRASVK